MSAPVQRRDADRADAGASDAPACAAYRGDLGGGLVRRWSTPADAERLALLFGTVFRAATDELPNPRTMNEAQLLLRDDCPFMTAADVAVVEDTTRPGRPLVACTCFWRHRWSFAGIPFGVTRPEMVGTDPAYRRRGLVRALFEMVHARGAAEGHLLSAITGIAYFYRQFGYEYVLDLEGGRTTYLPLIPEAEGDVPEACRLRPATPGDAPALAAMYARGRADSLVWHEAGPERWRYYADVWDDPTVRDRDVTEVGPDGRPWAIEDADGRLRGYAWLPARRWGRALVVDELAFAADARLPELVPSLLRALRDHALAIPAMSADKPSCGEIRFELGRAHPIYDVLGEALAPKVDAPYAWYIRVPDVPAFLLHVAPALEERLARSPLAGHTGAPKLDLYRYGMQLRLEGGRLVAIDPWRPPDHDNDEAALGCPPLVFLQLVLGYRSLAELRAIFPDVYARDDDRLLIETLFPKLASTVAPLG